MADPHIILGVHITERLKHAVDVQKVFTEYGCHIKTRVGLHDVNEQVCGPSGVVLLEFYGTEEESKKMTEALCAIEGVQVKSMVFDH